MTDMNNTEDRIVKMVSEYLAVKTEKVVDDAHFVDDLGADSLDIVEVVMAFEDEFLIDITDAEAETIETVKDAKELIARKLSEK